TVVLPTATTGLLVPSVALSTLGGSVVACITTGPPALTPPLPPPEQAVVRTSGSIGAARIAERRNCPIWSSIRCMKAVMMGQDHHWFVTPHRNPRQTNIKLGSKPRKNPLALVVFTREKRIRARWCLRRSRCTQRTQDWTRYNRSGVGPLLAQSGHASRPGRLARRHFKVLNRYSVISCSGLS